VETTARGRACSISPGALRLYRALIDAFITDGDVPASAARPGADELDEQDARAALDKLTVADWIARDEHGRVIALYPFSPEPTDVRVAIGGVERHAMCAIDALGVAPMLDRPVTVTSACPICDAEVHINVAPDRIAARRPRSSIVIRRRTCGSAHATRCSATRFACSPQHARDWIARHGGPDDVVLSLERAFIEARRMFARCYSEGRSC
jgi:hypothetical protein